MAGDDSDPVGFRPPVLREYALVADGERGGLIGPHGDLAWMCAPVGFGRAVLRADQRKRGVRGHPGRPVACVGGYYEPGSLIWRSRWVTTKRVIECRETLAFPGAPDRIVLLRQVCAVRGDARVRVVLEPRTGFGRHGSHGLTRDGGVWSGTSGPLRWRWRGGGQACPQPVTHGRGELLTLELTVPAGSGTTSCSRWAKTHWTGLCRTRPRPGGPPSPPGRGSGRRSSRPAPGGTLGTAGRRDRVSHRPAAGRRPGTEARLHRGRRADRFGTVAGPDRLSRRHRQDRQPGATSWPRSATSSATGPPAVRPVCCPRSTTRPSASCVATCPRRSCPPCCWNAQSRSAPEMVRTAGR